MSHQGPGAGFREMCRLGNCRRCKKTRLVYPSGLCEDCHDMRRYGSAFTDTARDRPSNAEMIERAHLEYEGEPSTFLE